MNIWFIIFVNKIIRKHRGQTSTVINELKTKYNIKDGFLPLSEYFQYLKNSKFALSPFGWGSICWKDFEIFLNGTMLIKPDMSHIKTWPNYYQNHKTYIPYKWDALNLKKIIYEISDIETDCKRNPEISGRGNSKIYLTLPAH